MTAARHPFRNIPVRAVIITTALAAALAACSGDPEAPDPCPVAGILVDAERIAIQEETAAALPDDISLNAQIDTVISQCVHGDGEVTVQLIFAGLAEKTSGSTAGTLTLPVFTAVIDGNDSIIERREHDVGIIFEDGVEIVEFSRQLQDIVIPVSDDAPIQAFRILSGFRLTPEQLAWNRSRN